MNILYIAHRIPYPPNKGDKIRSFHEIEYLSKRHTIHLACLLDDPEDLRYMEDLKKYCATVHLVQINKRRAKIRSLLALASRSPLSLAYFYSTELKQVIDQLLQEQHFDLIFVFSSSMVQFVSKVTNIPQVVDLVDVDSDKWLQYAGYTAGPQAWVYRIEGKRLQVYEKRITRQVKQCILASRKEVELLSDLLKDKTVHPKITAIPNGVDLEYFHPTSENCDPTMIVFTGAMDYFPNVDGVLFFSREVLPIIQEKIPDVKFRIVGRDPDKRIRKLANNKSISVTGTVADVRPYLASARVSVAPLRMARGIQNKILEAMAMGVPVVATSKAFEGIEAEPGEDLLIADDPAAFAQCVIEVLRKDLLHQSLSERGRRRMELTHNWDDRMGDLEEILIGVMGKRTLSR